MQNINRREIEKNKEKKKFIKKTKTAKLRVNNQKI